MRDKAMMQIQNQLTVQQEYIAQLLHELTVECKNLKSEQQQIARQYLQPSEEFTILEELELWINNICGYASQIQATAAAKDSNDAIVCLKNLRVSDHLTLAQFYTQAKLQYPTSSSAATFSSSSSVEILLIDFSLSSGTFPS
jgi:hypothetical protein